MSDAVGSCGAKLLPPRQADVVQRPGDLPPPAAAINAAQPAADTQLQPVQPRPAIGIHLQPHSPTVRATVDPPPSGAAPQPSLNFAPPYQHLGRMRLPIQFPNSLSGDAVTTGMGGRGATAVELKIYHSMTGVIWLDRSLVTGPSF